MFDTIRQTCRTYCHQIPANFIKKASQSAVYSFAATYVYVSMESENSDQVPKALISASTAAGASLIYSLTTPLFNALFEDNQITLGREFLKNAVAIGSTTMVWEHFTTRNENEILMSKPSLHSVNAYLAFLDTIPRLCEWAGEKEVAALNRKLYKTLGIQVKPGSGSLFIAV